VTPRPIIPANSGKRAGEIISRTERAGRVTLPCGWAASWECRIASFTAHVLELPIRYESGRRVPLPALKRGWLRSVHQ
jgi:hypothetical protein